MKGLTVGELMKLLLELMDRGDISKDDKMALVCERQKANPVTSVMHVCYANDWFCRR